MFIDAKTPLPDNSTMPAEGGLISSFTNWILAVGFEQRSTWRVVHVIGVGESFQSGRDHWEEAAARRKASCKSIHALYTLLPAPFFTDQSAPLVPSATSAIMPSF